MKLSRVETEVYSSDQEIGRSYYLGVAFPGIQIGDVLTRNNDAWRAFGNLAKKEKPYVEDEEKRDVISKILKIIEIESGKTTTVNLDGGATLSCSIDSGEAFDIAQLPDTVNGELNVNVSVEVADAFNIRTSGQWERLVSVNDLVREIEGIEGGGNLGGDCKDTTTTCAIVVEVFRTTAHYTSFVTKGDPTDFSIELDCSVENMPLAEVYTKLKKEIKSESRNNSLFDGRTDSVVPFVRVIKVRPMWKHDDGSLQPQPKPTPTGNRNIGNTKPTSTPPPDKLQVSGIQG